MDIIIKVTSLKHTYPDKTQVNILGSDFIVRRGEKLVLLGPNGSGKTTLIAHILGLLKAQEGCVEVLGLNPWKDFKNLRSKFGVLFQNVDEQIIGPRVFDDIAFSCRSRGLSEKETEERVLAWARKLAIEDLLEKIPHYLSGGQKKKVALAGALVMLPEILILDEPFESLDPESKKDMINIINMLNKENAMTVLLSTHDVNLVPLIADRLSILNKGQIILQGKPEEVFQKKEILEDASLEAPILVDLFQRLNNRGHNIDIALRLDEAEKILDKELKK